MNINLNELSNDDILNDNIDLSNINEININNYFNEREKEIKLYLNNNINNNNNNNLKKYSYLINNNNNQNNYNNNNKWIYLPIEYLDFIIIIVIWCILTIIFYYFTNFKDELIWLLLYLFLLLIPLFILIYIIYKRDQKSQLWINKWKLKWYNIKKKEGDILKKLINNEDEDYDINEEKKL